MVRRGGAARRRGVAWLCGLSGVAFSVRAAGQPSTAPVPSGDVTVRAERSAERPVAETLGAEQARASAGTQDDPVKALETLPGAARTGPQTSGFVLWGADPAESRLELDGVEVPFLFHGSGIRSVVPAGVLRTLTLVPGGYGPSHGRGLGGLVSLETLAPDHERLRYRAHADLLDTGALLSVPAGERAAVLVAGRFGYVDRWLPRVTDRDVGRLFSVPAYHDVYGKLTFEPAPGDRWSLQAYGSEDTLRREAPSSDAAGGDREVRRRSFQRLALHYSSERGRKSTRVLAFVGREGDTREASVDAAGWSLDVQRWVYSARAEHRVRVAQVALAFGVDALGERSEVARRGTLTLPPREGDAYAFGEPPGPDVASDRYTTHVVNLAPYASADMAWQRLRVSPGVRLNAFLIEVERLRPASGRVPAVGQSRARMPLEPRVSLAYTASERVEWFAAFGRYHQAPSAVDLSASFGNPTLELASATHLLAGERVRLPAGFALEIAGFARWSERLAARDAAATPRVAEVLRASGEGRSYGAQGSLQRELRDGWSGWLSWTASQSERRSAPNAAWRAFDHDQTHVVALSLQKRLHAWSFATLARYATGAPRTPVTGAASALSLGRYEPRFGALNSTRLPAFFELDLRVDRRFRLSERDQLSVYLEGLNVTGHEQAEEIVYSADYRQKAYLTGLPPLVMLGVRWQR